MVGITRTSIARRIRHGIRGAIVAVVMAGLRRRNAGAVVNGVITLAAAFLPRVVERRFDVEFRPWQRVYVEVAMLAHAVGMLGPYDDTWWWDHLTHAHSATLLGGAIHVLARRRGRDPEPRVLVATVGGGVLWELLEYGVHAVANRLGTEPVLVPYGVHDTLLDLLFDLVGALVVLGFGDRLLRNFTREAERRS
ncbi:hypothetical protein [Halalkalicoccus sp. NIPERK01]|uniref:hypothetical protein n=1 Tax=Halalkalicoccus sp. NIPERK01 TaxID=3053469 RepID=UPI00256F3E00|nr:hypothetical protein [Halalkalicoccus sp. NIPERK01]MDL5360527.1 hypothetical protein [Halalkalicoccus sp. NIPERK01]